MTIDLRNSTDYEVLRAAKVLARLAEVAREVQVDFLVVGATARTIISIGLLGTPPERQTKDIDIATEVDSWDEFERLARLLDERKGVHKFVVAGAEVDVVPYGGVERVDRTILWPGDHKMNVLGLREAVDSAETALLPDGVSVRVPSIPALALLKLFAWQDRHYDDTRDAVDLVTITKWYSSERYLDRLYTEWLDVLERFGYDPPLAGAWLLGGHMSDLLDDEAVAVLLDVVGNGDLMGRLARTWPRSELPSW
ncbi:nucleotidyl transferase AbiEii/AbiGii toxin family protein [Saccharothrix sp. NRRL B-16314]|uniref:nucleotidyl transferase AbiEii/AbiGii toxin family protein n=1 Tax=Saccharothrix sp. NRRL B-16314 TaxID=1463825 RepID=UPI0006900611|nr:nucleotidyl transferase AbiEii/AbiGii toxin family protein [Saccharothrix sp. NRRL B-16314]